MYQESQTYYLLFAGLLAGMGAVAYWGPKLWGRRLPDKAVGGLAALGLLGTVLAAFPYVIAGFLEPAARRGGAGTISTGPSSSATWRSRSASGCWRSPSSPSRCWRSAASPGATLVGDDPWDAQTLEWAVPSPAVAGVVPDLGLVRSAEPLLDAKEASGLGGAGTARRTEERPDARPASRGRRPERRHSLLVGTSFGVAAGAAAFAGLLGTYLVARERELDALREAGETVRFLPNGVLMPEIPANIMLFIFLGRLGHGPVGRLRHPAGRTVATRPWPSASSSCSASGR